MTREDIIRMAREAGLETHERKGQVRIGSAVFTGGDSTESMMRFAALVTEAERAAEREALEKIATVNAMDYEYVRWAKAALRREETT